MKFANKILVAIVEFARKKVYKFTKNFEILKPYESKFVKP